MIVNLNILKQKLELIQWLSTIQDAKMIEKIMLLRDKESKDWWNSISEGEKEAIQLGIKEAESGKLNPHSKAKALYEKWL
jgi:hypothetical protein